MTIRQREILDFLTSYIERNRYSPSYVEIGQALGVTGLATVHKHLVALRSLGLIHWKAYSNRSIEVVSQKTSLGALLEILESALGAERDEAKLLFMAVQLRGIADRVDTRRKAHGR